jgi:hypothetical protein
LCIEGGRTLTEILFEGLTGVQLLSLSDSELSSLVLTDSPVVFRAGAEEVLGQFATSEGRLIVEFAKIEAGGEGSIPAMWRLAGLLALRLGISEVEWLVHAISGKEPNLELQRVLESRGFEVREVEDKGQIYYYSYSLSPPGKP